MAEIRREKDLISWFKENIKDDGGPYLLDKHQARVILDNHAHTLVTARAGSGKTRTLVAKVVYLLTHEKVNASDIIVFAFNHKAAVEVNTRVAKITYRDKPIFTKPPAVATTFHAFAYRILGRKEALKGKIITEGQNLKIIEKEVLLSLPEETKENLKNMEKKDREEEIVSLKKSALQFINRAEQKFFKDYCALEDKLASLPASEQKTTLLFLFKVLKSYHQTLKEQGLINFNQLMYLATSALKEKHFSYKYILVDEYQDFSLLFMEEIKTLMDRSHAPHLIAVGDDWQAINRFAGSDVDYFLNFREYFPSDSKRLFIPTNYRSSKKIVKNANYFMSEALRDYNGCKTGNKKLRGKIYVKDVTTSKAPLDVEYTTTVYDIIKENLGKTIKILHRNNLLYCTRITLDDFCERIITKIKTTKNIDDEASQLISWSTIHRSKGLEADVVILLEIDSGKFPSKDKSNGLYQVFGDTGKTNLEDEIRLFYVALTRAKEKLYILTKTSKYTKENQKYNFLSYLESDELDWL